MFFFGTPAHKPPKLDERPVALVAGMGDLPERVAAAASHKGYRLAVLGVGRDDADPLKSFAVDYQNVTMEDGSKALDFFSKNRVRHLVMAGKVSKEKMAEKDFNPDEGCRQMLSRAGPGRGDERLMRAAAALLAARGIRVVGLGAFLEEDVTPRKVLTKRPPDDREKDDIRFGLKTAKSLGRLDIGQAVAVKNRLVLAAEAIEGTDRMIERVGNFNFSGLVLVKTAKPQQDVRFDMPVIGAGTVERARNSGFSVIACQAGKTLMTDRARCTALADEYGMTLIGV